MKHLGPLMGLTAVAISAFSYAVNPSPYGIATMVSTSACLAFVLTLFAVTNLAK